MKLTRVGVSSHRSGDFNRPRRLLTHSMCIRADIWWLRHRVIVTAAETLPALGGLLSGRFHEIECVLATAVVDDASDLALEILARHDAIDEAVLQ